MVKKVKILMITLVTVLCFASISIVSAVGPSSNGLGQKEKNNPNLAASSSKMQSTQDINQDKSANAYENTRGNALKERERTLEQTQYNLKDQIEQFENDINNLENQYREAVRTENQGQAKLLSQQIQQRKDEINSLKGQLKQIREQIKEEIRNSYTEEERNNLRLLEEELKEKYKDIKVLSVDSIIARGATFKFDTPPVIKEGRTLIPVRALTEGLGATVKWDEEKQEVTIQKDGTEIILQIGKNTAYVNGEEVKIDVPPEIMNNRTVVPLRFIAEKLGLKVDWDEESETIEIEDNQSEDANEADESTNTNETPSANETTNVNETTNTSDSTGTVTSTTTSTTTANTTVNTNAPAGTN